MEVRTEHLHEEINERSQRKRNGLYILQSQRLSRRCLLL